MFNFLKKFAGGVKRRLRSWREYGGFRATFSSFGANLYASAIVRSCVRTLAGYTSKADVASSKKNIEQMLKYKPNEYMNGAEFLYKIRTMYELQNTVFILIYRSGRGIEKFYPVPYTTFETLKDQAGTLFVQFKLRSGSELIAPWDDLIALRQDYFQSDIVGEDNRPVLTTLDMHHKADEALKNAMQSTANLRGVLKYGATGGLSSKDLDEKKDRFVKSYLSEDNKSGIGIIDKNMDFEPVNLSPLTATWTQMREFRENVYRYFGVNDKVVQASITGDEAQAFYEARIEPFLINLSLAMTSKIFTDRQLDQGNYIKFQSSALQFISMRDKLALKPYLDLGAITINEWRVLMNYAPVAWGDVPLRRLDTQPVNLEETQKVEEQEGGSDE